MKKRLQAVLFALALTSTSSILHAEGSIDAGKEKAVLCFSCHGESGNSVVSTFPKLAQQNTSYLVKQLQAYKNGTRKNAMMSVVVSNLSEDDMSDIAAYFSAQEISANQLPPEDDEEETDEENIDAELNEMRVQAGLEPAKMNKEKDSLLRDFLAKAGL